MDIRKVIKERGYTIEAVASKMGISRVTLSQNMSGNPTVSTLERIARAIDCDVADFFAGSKPDPAPVFVCPHCGKKIAIEIKKVE